MSELTITSSEKSEADLLAAMQTFAINSIDAVGMDNTVDTLIILNKMITTSPDIYKKLFNPENQKMFKELEEKYSGVDTMSKMDIMIMVPKLMAILKK